MAGRHTRSKFLSKCDSDTLEPIWALTGGESVLCRAWGARSGSRKFPAHLLKGTQESPFFEENSLKVTGCVCPNRRVKEDRCGVKSVLLILCPLPLHTHRSTLHLLCSARYPGSDPCRHIHHQLLALSLFVTLSFWAALAAARRESGLRGPIGVSIPYPSLKVTRCDWGSLWKAQLHIPALAGSIHLRLVPATLSGVTVPTIAGPREP